MRASHVLSNCTLVDPSASTTLAIFFSKQHQTNVVVFFFFFVYFLLLFFFFLFFSFFFLGMQGVDLAQLDVISTMDCFRMQDFSADVAITDV